MPKRKRITASIAVARFMVDVMRASATVLASDLGVAASFTDVMLFVAIWIGQAEGRPMTSGKLSTYLDVPRTTVTRKLEDFLRRGIVNRDASGRYSIVDHPRLASAIDANLQRFIATCAQLSKTDSGDIASS